MLNPLNTAGNKEIETQPKINKPEQSLDSRETTLGKLETLDTLEQKQTAQEQKKGEALKERQVEQAHKPGTTSKPGANTQDPVKMVLKRISGYQPANSLAPQNMASAMTFSQRLQQASSGDPSKALTWQATLLLKILRVIFRV